MKSPNSIFAYVTPTISWDKADADKSGRDIAKNIIVVYMLFL